MKKKFKKLAQKVVVSVLAFATAISFAPVAFAAQADVTAQIKDATSLLVNSQDIQHLDISMFDPANSNFTPLDMSSFYAAMDSLDFGAFSQLQYKLPTNVQSTNLLNIEYAYLVNDLKELGFGSTGKLEIPEFNPGYSTNITETFKEVYGDLPSKYDGKSSLPEGWTMENIMSQAISKRDEIANDVKNTEQYKTILNSINTSGLIVDAKSTLESAEMKSLVDLEALLKGSASKLEIEWSQKQAEGLQNIQKIATQNSGSVDVKTTEDLQDLFESAAGMTNTWIDHNSPLQDVRENLQRDYDEQKKELEEQASSKSPFAFIAQDILDDCFSEEFPSLRNLIKFED